MTEVVPDMTREQADELIAAWPIPDEVVGTRSCGSKPWSRGAERDLRHDQWRLRTGNGSDDRSDIGFDTVVGVGAERLCPHEVATKKVMVICWIAGMTGRGTARAKLVKTRADSLDWVVRYRRSMGVPMNRDMTPVHLKDFKSRISQGTIITLVPIEDRIRHRGASLRALVAEWPGSRRSPRANERLPGPGRLLAAELGVTVISIARCPDTINILREVLGSGPTPGSSEDAGRASSEPKRTSRSMEVLLVIWDDLYRLGKLGTLADGLNFEPFPGSSPASVSAVEGSRGKPREAVLPERLFTWLKAACTVVSIWGEPIADAVSYFHRNEAALKPQAERRLKSLAFDRRLPAGMPKLLLCWESNLHPAAGPPDARLSLSQAVTALLTSALILVMTFASCGVDEALQASERDIKEPRPGYYEIAIGNHPVFGPFRTVPIPWIVVVALRLLDRLTASTRALTGSSSLFEVLRSLEEETHEETPRRCSIPSKRYLARFGEFHALPALAAGMDRTTGDQFRKGFALALLYAVPGASWEALLTFLGLTYVHHLRSYIRGGLPGRIAALRGRIRTLQLEADPGTGKEQLAATTALLFTLKHQQDTAEEHHLNAFVTFALEIAVGTNRAGGRAGDRLESAVASQIAVIQADYENGFRNGFDPTEPASFRGMRELYKSFNLVPLPDGHAFCACRGHPGDLGAAVCLRRKKASHRPTDASEPPDRHPDLAYSGVTTCLGNTRHSDHPQEGRGGCAHAITTAGSRLVLDRMAQERKRAAVTTVQPDARATASAVVSAVLEAVRNARPKGSD